MNMVQNINEHIKSTYYIDYNSFFTIDISPTLIFGFDIGINSSFIPENERSNEYHSSFDGDIDKSESRGKNIIDLCCDTKFGFLFKKKKSQISLSFPFEFKYKLEYNINDYDDTVDDWSYKRGLLSGYGGVDTVTELFLPKEITIRLINNLGFRYSAYRRFYDNDNNFIIVDKSADYYYYSQYHIPLLSALSVNHKIKEKVLLFYGCDLGFKSYFGNGFDKEGDGEYELNGVCLNFDLGIFIGAEFEPLKWLTIRVGLKSLLVDWIFNTYTNVGYGDTDYLYDHYSGSAYHVYPDYFVYYFYYTALWPRDREDISNNNVSFPLNSTISAGVSFMPRDFFVIELNSNFVFTDISIQNGKVIRDYPVIGNSKKFEFSFSLGFVFKIEKQKSDEKKQSLTFTH